MSPLVIFQHVPLWVWLLLAGLIALGLRSSRNRTSPAWLMILPSALVVLGLRSLIALQVSPLVWALFAIAYGLGVLLGLRLQPRWTVARSGPTVMLRGEYLTLILMLALFGVNFALGMAQAVAPAGQLPACPAWLRGVRRRGLGHLPGACAVCPAPAAPPDGLTPAANQKHQPPAGIRRPWIACKGPRALAPLDQGPGSGPARHAYFDVTRFEASAALSTRSE